MRACKAPGEEGGRGLATRKKSRRGRKGEERRRAPARINVPSDELLPRNGRVQFASRRRERGERVSRAGHVVYKASDHSDGAIYIFITTTRVPSSFFFSL